MRSAKRQAGSSISAIRAVTSDDRCERVATKPLMTWYPPDDLSWGFLGFPTRGASRHTGTPCPQESSTQR